MRRLMLPLLCAGLLSACTPSMTTPASNTSPSPGASASPTGQTGNGAAAAFFGQGRMWEYNLSSQTSGVNTSGSIKIEVSKVEGDTATLTTTTTIAGATQTNSQTVKVNDQNAMANAGAKGTTQPTLVGEESVTVPAGQFKAKKYTATSTEGAGTGTVTYWLADNVGMVKEIVESKVSAAGMSFTSSTTLELKSYK